MINTSNMHADLKKKHIIKQGIGLLCSARPRQSGKGRTLGVAQKGRQELELPCNGRQKIIAGRQAA